MAIKPIRSVTKTITPAAGNLVLLDDGVSMGKATLDDAVSTVAGPLTDDKIAALDLGTASQSAVEDFATAAQGTKADDAIPTSDIGSTVQAYSDRLKSLADADDGTTGQVVGRASDGKLQFQNAGAGDVLSINDLSDLSNKDTALVNIGAPPAFASKAAAELFSPAVASSFVQLAGYSTAGDGGGAIYKKAISEPSHDGKFSITLADGVTVAWYEIAEKEIDPLQLPGADVTAQFDAAGAFADKIILTPGKTYTLPSKWTISRPLDLYLNGATIEAASGFTDGQLIGAASANVRIFGPGKIDGTNLPDITADFVGTVFTGFTVLIAQNQADPFGGSALTGIVIGGDVEIVSGSCAALAAYYCTGIVAKGFSLDGTPLNTTYGAGAMGLFVGCTEGQFNALSAKNRVWKGLSFSSCDGSAMSALLVSGNHANTAGHAGVHATGSDKLSFAGMTINGGFAFKTDTCSDVDATGLNADCQGVGEGGVIIQGGSRVRVSGVVRNFTKYGGAVQPDPDSGYASDHELDLTISNPSAAGTGTTSGYYLESSSSAGIAGLKLSGTITTVDIGIKAVISGSTSLISKINVDALRMYNIKNFLGYGAFFSLNVKGGSAQDCSGLTDGWRVWTGLNAEAISLSDLTMKNCGGARALTLDTTIGAIQAEAVSVQNCNVNGAAGVLYLNLASVSYYVKSLSFNGNTGLALSSASGAALASLSSTVVQLCAVGNTLLASDNSKRAIALNDGAKFKGIAPTSVNYATISVAPTAP